MQDCFRQHPEMYGSELEDDEDEVEEELRARESTGTLDSSSQEPGLVSGQPQPSQSTAQTESQDANLIKDSSTSTGKPALVGDEGGELTPKDFQRASAPSDKTA
jgi:mitochondrial intermembrane space import and assembly protein 40